MTSLPFIGWLTHAEQTDFAALAAHAWRMVTTMHGGKIVTAVLQPPDASMVAMLERIAASYAAHEKQCTDPTCGAKRLKVTAMCPGGKYDPSVNVFMTVGFDPAGQTIEELREVATDPAQARKQHLAACALLAGSIQMWRDEQPEA